MRRDLDLHRAEYIGARSEQQDMTAVVPLPSGGAMLVLADGLGGHESGAEASRIVVETFRDAAAGGRFDDPPSRRQALREMAERANARIGEGVDPSHGHRGMASTVVAAIVDSGEVSWVSVGDSHLYIWRQGKLSKLNEDHSQAGLMVRSGQYQPGDPEVQAVKSVLVSALTGRKLELVDLPQRGFKVEPGDVLMLASDGLNTLNDAEIAGIVAATREQGARRLATALLEEVRNRRVERQDNTTVAIARIPEPQPIDEPKTEVAARAKSEPHAGSEDDEAEPPAADTAPQLATHADVTLPVRKPLPSPPAERPAEPASIQSASDSSAPEAPKPPTAAEPAFAAPVAGLAEARRPQAAVAVKDPVDDRRAASAARTVSPVLADARPLPAAILDETEPAAYAAPDPGRWEVEHRQRVTRLYLGLGIIVVVMTLMATLAIAALKPAWLSGIIPGFSASGDRSPAHRSGAAPAAPAAPAKATTQAPPDTPGAAPAVGVPPAQPAPASQAQPASADASPKPQAEPSEQQRQPDAGQQPPLPALVVPTQPAARRPQQPR
ncbi:MAG: protein phosphatase 2C domain-containing protein [Proteobacteria bacterium]|nr:protein phosphatase 2C domain-containing protein [Pseudomonadota bacterium]